MTKYDYIFHPDPKANGEYTVQGMDLDSECVERRDGPVIVLTIEELRDIWNAGRQHLREAMKAERADEPELIVSPNFETYLTSKGIEI